MQNAVFNPRRTANGIKVEPFAERIAKVEAQLAQQRVNAQQTQKLAGMTGAEVGKFAFSKTAFEDPIKRGNVGLPRRRTPVQVIIDIKRRTFYRRGDAEEVHEIVGFITVQLTFQRGSYARRRAHPYAIGRQTAKTGIDQSVRQRQGIAANIKIPFDTAIFLPPQPALGAAKLKVRPAVEINVGIGQRGAAFFCPATFRRRWVVVEIANGRQPRGVLPHRQGCVDFTPLGFNLRSPGIGPGDKANVIPALARHR